jgi:hypothetical protein
MYRTNHLKHNPSTIIYNGIKVKKEEDTTRVILSNLLHDTQVKVTLVARPLVRPVVKKLCRCEHGVLTAECVFILKHYLALKSSVAAGKAFGNAYKEVPNMIKIRLVTKFRDTGSFGVSLRRWQKSAVNMFCNFF